MYTDKLFTGQRNMAGLGIYHYQSRFYSPKLGRFLSADSIVPNPFNPQDFNRYSYVRNNPVRYTDPSGHRACITPEECADMGITPGGNPSKPKPKLPSGGGGGRRGNDTPDPNPNNLPAPIPVPEGPTTIQLAQDGISGLYITIFPEGSTPSVDRTPEQLESAEDWAALGLFMDLVEGIAIAYPGDLFIGEYVMSAVDILVTGRSCYLYGQCYIGRPDPSLPPMLVINQDIIVTGTDFVVPIVGGAVTGAPTGGLGFYPGSVASDIVTTFASFFYDLGRITGEIPNGISVGFTLKGDWYILVYPP